jgi:catechol 2,3-dioxygenase-like lactoylglutathione lyase family enzyme
MSRGLDHIVHAVRDLEAAAALYRQLGFTVGARNRHPWGTHNHIVQLPGFFMELLTVAEPDKLGSDGFSRLFGSFNQDFLAHREGLSYLMLESHDAGADAAEFRAAGIAVSEALHFEREGKRPDGTSVKVAFSLAFARDPAAEIGFATCLQHHPENFWNPTLQQHPNGVIAIAGAVIVAENPSDHQILLSTLTGERELVATSSGIMAPTPRGSLAIMDPSAFRSHFGVASPVVTDKARLAALRFKVLDRPTLERTLEVAGAPYRSHMGQVVVGPDATMGAVLAFEPGQ